MKGTFSIRLALILIGFLIILAEGAGYMGMYLLNQRDPMKAIWPDRFLRLRDVLAKKDGAVPRYVSAVNLNYMPTPGYHIGDRLIHNEDGYRGPKVPCRKGNDFRILFLGGSTTYGTTVQYDYQTFPEQTKKALAELFAEKPIGSMRGREVEIINAGLEGGYSSDELNAYLYKFRYYRPDLVVVHSGGNDAELDITAQYYTPDQVNMRTPEIYQVYRYHIPPIFFRSWFFSFIVIRFYLYDKFNHDQPRMEESRIGKTYWFDEGARSSFFTGDYMKSPFARNFETLAREVSSDGAGFVIIPFAINMRDSMAYGRPDYVERVNLYNDIMKKIGARYGAVQVDYRYDLVDGAYWVDDCHLLPPGEEIKGKTVAEAIYNYLSAEDVASN